MRLFVAVPLPEPVVDLVAELPRPVRTGLRWTTPAQWHVTLRFLGEAPPEAVIGAFADDESTAPTVAPLACLGPATAWFPGRRVLQVPVTGLESLAATVEQVTRPWGTDDDHPFTGHLTLARTVGRRRGPPDLAGTALSAEFRVTEFGVYSSRPGPRREGPVYDQLRSFSAVRR